MAGSLPYVQLCGSWYVCNYPYLGKQTEGVTQRRFSPNFSKRCTHLIVSSEQSDASQLKVYLASINKDKWHAHAVRYEWLMECATQHRQVAEDNFEVQPPRHEVGHEWIQHITYTCMHNRSDSHSPHVSAGCWLDSTKASGSSNTNRV